MSKLAECARKGDRNGIIETSKVCERGDAHCVVATRRLALRVAFVIARTQKIAEVIKKIREQTKALGESCRDAQLKESILTASTAMSNFGTQLKILAAVKAASVGKDAAAENQLLTCCEGIATSVRAAMFNAQSAKQAGKV